MNITNYIIHKLGGQTLDESLNAYTEGWVDGKEEGVREAAVEAYEYSKDLNGLDADTWCNSMYSYLKNKIYGTEKG